MWMVIKYYNHTMFSFKVLLLLAIVLRVKLSYHGFVDVLGSSLIKDHLEGK